MELQDVLPDKKYITRLKKKEYFMGLKICLNVSLKDEDLTPGIAKMEKLLDNNKISIDDMKKSKNSFWNSVSAVYKGSIDRLDYKLRMSNMEDCGEDIALKINQSGHSDVNIFKILDVIKQYVSLYDENCKK